MIHSYKTILNLSCETLHKAKGSKFFGYAFPVQNEIDISNALSSIKKKHPKAHHFCYGWQLGTAQPHWKVSDDGEPGNTAGMPIFGQIKSFELTFILVIVVRYFGGTKLGVGGLITAYRTSAKLTLQQASIVERIIKNLVVLTFDYTLVNTVQRIIKKHDLDLVHQAMEVRCTYTVGIKKSQTQNIIKYFKSIFGITVHIAT